MKWTPRLLPYCIALAAGTPLAAYALSGRTGQVLILLALGVWWLVGVYRKQPSLGNLCATGILLMVMIGALSDLPSGWLLVGTLALLAAWDMEHFYHRCHLVARIEASDDLERRHLGQLALILGIGAILAGLSLGVHLRLNFAVAVLLTLLAALGLRRLLSRLRRQSD
ncbi:MAG TPA: hypothetical protein PKH77_16380 [Anaerolineae bacterium]|nr:hypothetical protein [Anaerolineae bacterium]